MKPLISVIVPVYNVSPFLREAVDSVINQTWQNLEILLVDDGSTDGSGEICDEYLADPRVKVIHQENRGLSGARNTGLDRAVGEYIVFLDGDDALHPKMIERLYQALVLYDSDLAACGFNSYETEGCLTEADTEKTTSVGSLINASSDTTFHTDREMIQAVAEAPENEKNVAADSNMLCATGKTSGSNGNDLTECNKTMRTAEDETSPRDETAFLTHRDLLCAAAEDRFPRVAWNKLYTKRLWEDVRYPEGHVHEDLYVIPRLLEKCERAVVVPQPLVYYRKRNGSITETYTVQNVRDNITAYQGLLEYFEQVQPPLPSESLHLCRENALQEMIIRWAELRKAVGMNEDTESLKKEILSLAGDQIQFRKPGAEVLWRMFLYLPGMIIPVRNSIRMLRRVEKKTGTGIRQKRPENQGAVS